MTKSEAIKGLLAIRQANGETIQVDGETIRVHEVVNEALQALKKQIPKKPQNKKYSLYPHSSLLKSRYGDCPVCKSIQVDDNYCANCGQKLDWSDE